jgi:hypothetical protein
VAHIVAQNPKDMTGEKGTLGDMAPEVHNKLDHISFTNIVCCFLWKTLFVRTFMFYRNSQGFTILFLGVT